MVLQTQSLIQHQTSSVKKKKAHILGFQLNIPVAPTSYLPEILKDKLGPLKSTAGLTKSLELLPKVTIIDVENYMRFITSKHSTKFSQIKKNFDRASQFISESYFDMDSIHIMNTDEFFIVKGICAASLKKLDRWITVAITKSNNKVEFAYCHCPAGKGGTCSHSFGLMKLCAKWVIEGRKEIPSDVACTSRSCVWSVPKSRGRVNKEPIASLKPFTSTKTKPKTSTKKMKERLSTLYDARSKLLEHNNSNKLNDLVQSTNNENPSIPFLSVVRKDNTNQPTIATTFGHVHVGSVLSNQCPLVSSDFTYCTINLEKNLLSFVDFPNFPIVENDSCIDKYIQQLSVDKQTLIDQLRVSASQISTIEIETREQSNNPEWFKQRANRFTASKNNTYRSKDPKTTRGFVSLAKSLVHGITNKSAILNYKLNYGKYYEPIAIQKYEHYMKSMEHIVSVEPSGLIVDRTNFIFSATPDGKVIDTSEKYIFGILEVKCSEEYKDIDPADIPFISKTSCLKNIDGKLSLRKEHSYYDQITIQLALSTQTWCDFIFYTSKGIVIDRITFDKEYWNVLSEKISKFYFDYMLDILIEERPSRDQS